MAHPETLTVLRRRRMALARMSRISPAAAPVLVHDPVAQLPVHGGGTVRRFRGSAFVWERGFDGVDPKDACSVWVASDDRGYADIYRAFLAEIYGLADFSCLTRSAPAAERHEIDHVSGRVLLADNYADARSGSPISADSQRYHLIEAVPARANSSSGGGEKKMSRSHVVSAFQRRQRLLNWTQLVKLYGLMTPRSRADAQRYAEALRVMSADGWSEDEIRTGLDGLFDLAGHRRPE
ncbi:hypothetical protein [Mangrovicoccus sp. HB161399]|uniref:hypothetical protein n=1 Tax=Mangrovicoccus sp. HB161399 TaxID=2720392 RepID=UPI001552AB03|nr:hypothetical protein [Mangrovicoccus sp. HB161399]